MKIYHAHREFNTGSQAGTDTAIVIARNKKECRALLSSDMSRNRIIGGRWKWPQDNKMKHQITEVGVANKCHLRGVILRKCW